MNSKLKAALLLSALGITITACGGIDPNEVEYKYPRYERGHYTMKPPKEGDDEGLFGKGGIKLFGGKSNENAAGGGGIGVNSFLWRACLDTLSFMPLASADAFGGVIITEWYSPPETKDERFKINAFILGRALRADGIKVAVFRQTKNEAGEWIDAKVTAGTVADLENAILTRARELRIALTAK